MALLNLSESWTEWENMKAQCASRLIQGKGKQAKSWCHVEAICFSICRLHLSQRVQKQYELELDGIGTCKRPTMYTSKYQLEILFDPCPSTTMMLNNATEAVFLSDVDF